jgi:hypothetical protein
MTVQTYLIVENNVVTNNVLWDGNVNTWQPPTDSIQLVQATTPALIWQVPEGQVTHVLTEFMGIGDIGFTWDGTALTTNQPKPADYKNPITTGTKSA